MRSKIFLIIILTGIIALFSGFNSNNTLLTNTYVLLDENYEAMWKEVRTLTDKGLPKSALVIVDKIYEQAKKEKNAPQFIKATLFKMRLQSDFEENYMVKVIDELNDEIKTAEEPIKQILHSAIAEVYWSYYQANRFRFLDRGIIVGIDHDDIETWDLQKIMKEIISNYLKSLDKANDLKNIPLVNFDLILEKEEGSGQFRPTLYDFLAHRAADFFMNDESSLTQPVYKFEINKPEYFSKANEFIKVKLTTRDSMSLKFYAMEILQDLITFHIDDKDPEALIDVDLKRLGFVRAKTILTDKDSLYLNTLIWLEDKYKDFPGSSEVSYKIARFYYEKGQQYNPLESDKYRWDIKKAYEYVQKAINIYPDAFGSKNCLVLKEQILDRSLFLTTDYANTPDKPFPGLVSYKNISNVYLRIIRMGHDEDKELRENFRREELINQYRNFPVYKEWEVQLIDEGDYQKHNVEIRLPELPLGYYVILTGTNKDFVYNNAVITHSGFWITNISYISQRKPDGAVDVYVLDRDHGSPVKDVQIQAYYQEYDYSIRKYVLKKGDSYTSDKDGYFSIPTVSSQSHRLLLEFIHKDDKLVTPNYFFQQRQHQKEKKKIIKTYFFTDRAIYRPGQTVYFKGIILEHDGEKYEIKPDFNTIVAFYDVNNQKVSELNLVSNEYGSVNGFFVAPLGVLTGNMQIKSNHGSVNISVEEYKRPKFEVVFNPIKGSYKLNEMVKVSGKAIAYSGNNIDHANTRYRVVRKPMFPFWRNWWYDIYPVSGETEITNGFTTTDENGEFFIVFKAIPDLSINNKFKPTFNYVVYADVTDINGETHSGQLSVNIGYNSLLVDINIPEKLNREKAKKYYIKTTNLNGEFEPAKGNIKIYRLKQPERILRERNWARPDVFIIPEEEYHKDFPNDAYADEDDKSTWEKIEMLFDYDFDTEKDSAVELKDITAWKPGDYVMDIKSKDKFGVDIEIDRYFTLFSPESGKVPVNTINWFTIIDDSGEPGEVASFLIGTNEKKIHVFYEILQEDKIIKKELFELNKGQKLIEIPIQENYRGNIGVNLTFVRLNRSFQNKGTIIVPYTNKELDIEFSSFRNKLLPGQQEEWNIKIKDKKGDVVAADMLAAMYDASLDAFKANQWPFDLYKSLFRFMSWNINDAFLTKTSRIYKTPAGTTLTPLFRNYDRLNWFGFRMSGYRPLMGKGIREYTMMRDTKAMPGAIPVDEVPVTESEKESAEIPQKKEFTGIQVRRDFKETAFFYPDLKTDEEGNIIIRFIIPESLTRWKMMGLAYTKDLKIGQVVKDLVTQKDLMVLPNPPRFFRQGDRMAFSAKVVNLSDRTLTGTVELEFYNTITMEPVDIMSEESSAEQNFTVSKGNSQAVDWNIIIPEDVGTITYRIIAQSRHFSDGEEMAIPVLTNRMMVTESLPLPINGKETRHYRFDKLIDYKSGTIRNYKLTLEFTSNPAWYAVQALPYLMENTYESSEQVFSRFYANSIASHIANSNPKIKRVFENWKNLTPDALLSNLEKNQDLKAVILEETPWVLQAQNESERKQRIGLLFDLNTMAGNLTSAIQKLKKKQSPNGGWPWFEGMRESRYITQHIVTGFGHLDHLGVSVFLKNRSAWNMVNKAVLYLDDRMREDYEYIKENYPEKMEDIHISRLQIQYLYARSYFKDDIILNKRNDEAFNYFMEQAGKYWLKQNKYLQGMIALALHRYGERSIPSDIIKSLKEHALYNEEMGMYWRSPSGYFWYQAPVERQALLIEAFDEVAHDMESVEKMKAWLLKQKQTQDWKTTKATTEACYALLLRGTDLLASDEPVDIILGKQKIDPKKMDDVTVEAGTGYFRTSWPGSDIKSEMGNITVTKSDEGIAWGAIYWQYFENLDKITRHETPLSLNKKLFVERNTPSGPVIEPVYDNSSLSIGDKVIVRIELRSDRDMEYIHLKDMRAATFEPVNVLSGYRYKGGLGYYESTGDASTNFFIGYLSKGTYVFEYPLIASQKGDFSNGITSVQCMYAPEFGSHSEGIRVKVE